jgi:hypothetical protein
MGGRLELAAVAAFPLEMAFAAVYELGPCSRGKIGAFYFYADGSRDDPAFLRDRVFGSAYGGGQGEA